MATEAPKEDSQTSALPQRELEFLNLVVTRVLQGHAIQRGGLMDRAQITVEPSDVATICRTLKNDARTDFKLLLCMLAVDHKEYIQMVYLLQSLEHEHTLAIKTDLPYDEPRVPTVSDIWRAAHWYERETHDLFGVEFEGNPDLSPLLLYEGFEGYPGRKEFPLHEYDEF